MSPVTASPYWTLLFVVFVSADPKIITAESGQNITLTCRAPNNKIRAVEWIKADLGDEYVLFYQDGHFIPDHQHPSFKNRVDLQDRQMKDGDVSLILKDVTIKDTGTYDCHVFMREIRSMKHTTVELSVVPPDPKIITAESGQDVTLTCRAPNNKISAVEWIRADLGEKYAFLYQDGQFVPDKQHPSFKNRVDLQDRQMKDGDVSLILKHVTINDSGKYVCHVYMEGTRSSKLNGIVYLSVDPPGILRGYPVWMIGLGLVVVVVVVVLIYKTIQQQRIKRRKQAGRPAGFSKLNSESPPAVPRSQSCPTRRKTDDQGQKETDDADLHHQSPS